MFNSFLRPATALAIIAALHTTPALAKERHESHHQFQRIATFPVFRNTDVTLETVAEIVAVSEDGNTLIYTDSATENLGFVDIRNPYQPLPLGVTALGGEPTSVAVVNHYALAAVNTSPGFIAPSGKLVIIDINTQSIVDSFDLGGQPDSIAVSPDKRYAAIAIENERDEDLGDGAPPQAPAGYLSIVDLNGEPADWGIRKVDLTGLPGMLYSDDPEPEYVDINHNNLAVLTLQENNHIALIDLPTGTIVNHFSAGMVNLQGIDVVKNKLIEQNGVLTDVPREPDGVSWISDNVFATADEGDLNGGGRGFTLFDTHGRILYTAGNRVEQTVVQYGHYPEKRAGKKGNEPENVDFARFGKRNYLFLASERASVILAYQLNHHDQPRLKQVLPAAVKPEGLLAIPSRGLLVAASEEDARDDKIRSAITIYKYNEPANYPTVISRRGKDHNPIPWGALSGLAADREDDETVYTVHDSFYDKSRIFKMNVDHTPAIINKEIVLKDRLGKLAVVAPQMVNDDATVNLDQEGIATSANGGFWIASEGRGTIGDPSHPFETYDLLLKVNETGTIEQVVMLPETVNARQVRFGFEGVASVGAGDQEVLYVAFQREWAGDPKGFVRIGRYDVTQTNWSFYYYPLDARESANGGWVGLSEITAEDGNHFLVIERDNQGNNDAAIKRIYRFSVSGLQPQSDDGEATPAFPVLSKQLVKDLMPVLQSTGGQVLEKIEGLTILHDGRLLIVNDNDGVDDSNGETQLLNLH